MKPSCLSCRVIDVVITAVNVLKVSTGVHIYSYIICVTLSLGLGWALLLALASPCFSIEGS